MLRGLRQCAFIMRRSHCQTILVVDARPLDEFVRRAHDGRRGPIVRGQTNDLAHRIRTGELRDGRARIRAPERVDGLSDVADDEDILFAFGQKARDLPLDGAGVLRLVDEERRELRLVLGPHVFLLLQKAQCLDEQIVEVQAARRLFREQIEFGLFRHFVVAPEFGEGRDGGVGMGLAVIPKSALGFFYQIAPVLRRRDALRADFQS